MGDIVVGIDIGSSKVCTVIGRLTKANELEVLGTGIDLCNGVKKGVIIDIESTAKSIKASIEQAESQANLKIGSAYINIAGAHVNIINSRNNISISGDDREITRKDLERLLHSIKNISIPEDRQIIDIIPQQYIIDGYDEIIDPIGMVGINLEVDADIILGKITSVQNIVKSMEKANIKIDGLVLETMATSEMVMAADEKEMGVILIDVGAGVTDVSVYKNKRLVFNDSIPVGGDHITNDIAIGLKISHADAEKLKREYELALTSLIKNDQEVSIFDISENCKKTIKVSDVVEIIEARVYEIFSLCSNLVQKLNIHYASGVVLTGGGISYVDGCKQLAAEVFELPVRIASIRPGAGLKSELITAAGIVKYVSGIHKGGNTGSEVKILKQKIERPDSGIVEKISRIFKKLF